MRKVRMQFTMPEAMLCTRAKFGEDDYGWLGSVYGKEMIPHLGKWFKVTVTVEEVTEKWKKKRFLQK